ncbi:MAG: DUF4340 domain-containing protein [Pseudomonadota bacterium]
MNPKTLPILAGVTAIAVALAFTSARYNSVSDAISDRGRQLLPGLAERSKAIAKMTVTTSDGTTTLVRDGDRMVDASGYPIRDSLASTLTTSLSVLKIEERKTDDPARYADLGLAAPDAKDGAGTRVVATSADGATLADVVLGRREAAVGGMSGGQYVRTAANARSFLVRGNVRVPPDRSGWFNTQLLNIAEADLTTVTAPDFKVARKGDELALDPPLSASDAPPATGNAKPEPGAEPAAATGDANETKPAAAAPELDPNKLNRVKRMFAPLTFIDVRKADASAPSGPAVTLETKDGLAIKLTTFPTTDDEVGAWARLEASAQNKDAEPQAKTMSEEFAGYDFKIGTGDYNTLILKRADFAKKPPRS